MRGARRRRDSTVIFRRSNDFEKVGYLMSSQQIHQLMSLMVRAYAPHRTYPALTGKLGGRESASCDMMAHHSQVSHCPQCARLLAPQRALAARVVTGRSAHDRRGCLCRIEKFRVARPRGRARSALIMCVHLPVPCLRPIIDGSQEPHPQRRDTFDRVRVVLRCPGGTCAARQCFLRGEHYVPLPSPADGLSYSLRSLHRARNPGLQGILRCAIVHRVVNSLMPCRSSEYHG